MEPWSAHHLFKKTSEIFSPSITLNMQNYINELRSSGLPIIFSIGHLGRITNIDYALLHDTVNRKRESANYNLFAIRKRSGQRRFIHAVNGKLFDLQKYINTEILQKIAPHPASFAFHPSGGIRKCASVHCGCRWLFQFDLKDFFYSISEPLIFQVFQKIGYKKLLSFELSRICTTLSLPKSKKHYIKHSQQPFFKQKLYSDLHWDDKSIKKNQEIKRKPYITKRSIGVLPQGAPTSPMLSNLAARKLDDLLYDYAQNTGFVYTRYADDMTFSANILPPNKSIGTIKREIISIIRKCGFIENKNKFRVAGPGSKKTVLGLLVDGQKPRISREILKRIDRHLHASIKFGIDATRKHEGFDSTYGFYNHISGLMSFIQDVDYERWSKLNGLFKYIETPFEDV